MVPARLGRWALGGIGKKYHPDRGKWSTSLWADISRPSIACLSRECGDTCGAMYSPLKALPLINTTHESETLDFKARVNRLDDGKIDLVSVATPVAAFANRLGGTILFGASQQGSGPLLGFAPHSVEDVAATLGACDAAIKERCVPCPQWSSTVIACDGGSVVALNVEPHPSALVAVRVSGDKAKGYGGDAFVFPLRVGTQTNYLTADQTPMFMNPKVRRTLLLLSRIGKGEPVRVVALGDGGRHVDDQFISVDEEKNVVVLTNRSLPLDFVESVWCGTGVWRISTLLPL